MPLTIIFLGKAGSGKGTQAHFLERKIPNIKIIGTGDMLRAFAKSETPAAARIAKEVVLGGILAPTWLVSYLWIYEMLHTELARPIVFDGSPRMLPEAIQVDEVLDWNGRIPPKVFLLDISDAEAEHRLFTRRVCTACKKIYQGDSPEFRAGICPCGGALATRHDDTPAAIKNRLAWYKAEVMPVIEHYEGKDWLVRINGERASEKVHEDILAHLGLSG